MFLFFIVPEVDATQPTMKYTKPNFQFRKFSNPAFQNWKSFVTKNPRTYNKHQNEHSEKKADQRTTSLPIYKVNLCQESIYHLVLLSIIVILLISLISILIYFNQMKLPSRTLYKIPEFKLPIDKLGYLNV